MACRVYIPGTTGWLYRRPDTVFVTVLGWYGSLALVGGVHVCNTSESPSHFVSQRLRYRTAIQPSYNPKITADRVDVSRNPRTQAVFRLYLQQLALPRKAYLVSSSTTLARSLALFSRTDYARERYVSPRIPHTHGDLFRAGSRGGLGRRGRGRAGRHVFGGKCGGSPDAKTHPTAHARDCDDLQDPLNDTHARWRRGDVTARRGVGRQPTSAASLCYTLADATTTGCPVPCCALGQLPCAANFRRPVSAAV